MIQNNRSGYDEDHLGMLGAVVDGGLVPSIEIERCRYQKKSNIWRCTLSDAEDDYA